MEKDKDTIIERLQSALIEREQHSQKVELLLVKERERTEKVINCALTIIEAILRGGRE